MSSFKLAILAGVFAQVLVTSSENTGLAGAVMFFCVMTFLQQPSFTEFRMIAET